MKKIILLTIGCLALAGNVVGQEAEISGDRSDSQLRAAFAKFSEVSYRRNLRTEYFVNGSLSSSFDETEELMKPDKSHFVTTFKSAGAITRTELISIGNESFCRKDDGPWKNSKEDCIQRVRSLDLGEEVKTKYTVRKTTINGQKASVYRRYVTFDDGAGRLSYWDYKFWISESGFILRREIITGLENTKEIFSSMIETSQINPKDLKIEIPIKSDEMI